jgi:phosphoglucosamine mutase
VTMSRNLFGTDGIRGVPGAFPLDSRTLGEIGCRVARRAGSGGKILLGRDTRESGPWMEARFAEGIRRGGGEAVLGGVLTTPAVAWLARDGGFAAGIAVSASHNPWRDNGIKIFSRDGFKLPDEEEAEMERGLEPPGGEGEAVSASGGLGDVHESFLIRYVEYLASCADAPPGHGARVALDCANGAAFAAGPRLFEKLGFSASVLSASPDGRNINEGCGALHPEALARETAARGALLGAAFDGDADRAVFAGPSGRIYDGDDVLLLLAERWKREGLLAGNAVVGTVMSNAALAERFAAGGIAFRRADVGDRYVLKEMRAMDAVLGGEPSGHVISLRHATTGDGLLTAALVAGIAAREGKSLDELLAGFEKYPQLIVNLRVREKRPLDALPRAREAVREAEAALAAGGRVLVRYSGTEPKVRLMAEGPDEALLRRLLDGVAEAFRAEGVVAE